MQALQSEALRYGTPLIGGQCDPSLSKTETRTECSGCGVETTVPFKPTQGRPVLCRSCFQMKRVPAAVAAVATMNSPEAQIAAALEQQSLPPSAAMETIRETPLAIVAGEQESDLSPHMLHDQA